MLLDNIYSLEIIFQKNNWKYKIKYKFKKASFVFYKKKMNFSILRFYTKSHLNFTMFASFRKKKTCWLGKLSVFLGERQEVTRKI